MSIESNIAELTAAVRELTAAILAGQWKDACAGKCSSPVTAAEVRAERQEGETLQDTKKRLQEKPAPTAKPEAASTQPTATEQASAPEQKVENSAAPLDYKKDVKPLFLQLINTPAATLGRPAAIALIEEFKPGAKRLDEALTPDMYADAIERIKAAIEKQSKVKV